MKSHILFITLIFSFLSPAIGQEGLEKWYVLTRKSDGQTLPKPARILSITDKEVQIQLQGAQGAMRVAKEIFSDEDQEVFKNWLKEQAKTYKPRMEISVNTGKRTDRDDRYYDADKDQRIQFKIAVENDDNTFDIEGAKLTAWGFGRSADNRGADIQVMSREEFDLDLKAGEETELQGKAVTFSYDDSGRYRHGYKFYAYLVAVKNASGNLIAVQGIPTAFEENAEAAFKLEANDYCDRALRKTDSDGNVEKKKE